jgi:hypothetical protein
MINFTAAPATRSISRPFGLVDVSLGVSRDVLSHAYGRSRCFEAWHILVVTGLSVQSAPVGSSEIAELLKSAGGLDFLPVKMGFCGGEISRPKMQFQDDLLQGQVAQCWLHVGTPVQHPGSYKLGRGS